MGSGWRRAFCTTIPRDPHESTNSDNQERSPRRWTKMRLFSTASNPSTPRLHSHEPVSSPKLQSPKTSLPSYPSSPPSPLKLSFFKNSFKFRSGCGICLNVKSGQGTAVYTAECAHAFHFPCIAAHVRKHGNLVCPVCNTTWKDDPLLAVHVNLGRQSPHQSDAASENNTKPNDEGQNIVDSSPRAVKTKGKIKLQNSKPHDSRSYDDDEPLLSPIIPIPEADEDCDGDENCIQEFQGSSSMKKSDEAQINGRDLRSVEVKMSPESALVTVGRTHETYAVALRVKAPPPPPATPSVAHSRTAAPLLDPTHRAPIDLVTVLDASGNMTGVKLQMLKRAMRLVISSLGLADRLSIVACSASPKRLLPLKRMTAQGQSEARRIIDQLKCGQGTSIRYALRKATKVLEDRRDRNPIASIMLLSVGQNDGGPTNEPNQRMNLSHASSARFAHIQIPTHSLGDDAFAKCVGGLLSVVVQDLKIELHFASGEISAVYSYNQRPTVLNVNSVRLGDLYAAEERELLVELKVPTPSNFNQADHLMSVKCSYKNAVAQNLVYDKEQALLIPRPHAVRSSGPRIERLRNLFITTKAIAESRRLIDHSEYTSAHYLLASARALMLQSSLISADEYIRGLESEMEELHWRRQGGVEIIQWRRGNERGRETVVMDENGEPLTPMSAWRAAERLAKMAKMKKSLNRVSDLHGFENARF